ncbi:MAG: DUF5753 domain-containing protein [Streptosporangiaceae bacterium]
MSPEDIEDTKESAMVLRESLDADASLWDWVAVDLYFYRVAEGLSCAQLGMVLGVNRQAVSNMEAGRLRLDEAKARKLDERWKLNEHFSRLLRYARAGHDSNWFKQHVLYESRASELKMYESVIVHGLLQTPDYARALLVAGQAVEDVDATVAVRMGRQAILKKRNPPVMWVLLNQAVLMPEIGGREVMREQLRHLLDLSRLPNIVIRVIPFSLGAHVGLDGSFLLTTVAEGEVAYMEANGGGRLSIDPAEVRRYRIKFDRLGADASSREESRHLISGIMENL